MKLLLDTHLLLWAAGEPERLSRDARALLASTENELFFSAASLWEVVIKRSLGRDDFRVDARLLRRGLLDNGYSELPVASEHVVAVEGLPPIHKDPFDRVLLAQAQVEGITLLTADPIVARYPGPVRLLRSRSRPSRTRRLSRSASTQ
jgi:PIN domain nuclease of toxin-antitoxin system